MNDDGTIMNKLKKGCAVRGTGYYGAKCTYLLGKAGIEIKYYISKNKGVETFRGKEIHDKNDDNLYIIVATSQNVYLEIADELRGGRKTGI